MKSASASDKLIPTPDHKSTEGIHPNRLTLTIFFFFGICGCIPWNAAVACLDFYQMRFEPHGHNPGYTFGFVFNWPLMVGTISLLYFTKKVSGSIRIYVSLMITLICSFSMPFITQFISPEPAWWILMISIAINGASNGIVQGSFYTFT